ncbi:MAG: ABC transporter permease [Anaerolineales bacterium]
MTAMPNSWMDGLYNIWVIASKDIRDAIKSRLILSLILTLGFLVATPRLITLILVQPAYPIAVFDAGDSELTQALEDDVDFTVRKADTLEHLEFLAASAGIGPGVDAGLLIPAGFDGGLDAGTPPELRLYVSWANRGEIETLVSQLAERGSELLGRDEALPIESRVVYPSTGGFQMLGLLGLASVSVITMMGLFLVPHLFFEEKRTKTLDALLIAPASIGQVVMGKMLAGMFYILVAAIIVFLGSWPAIVHWEVAVLFALASGLVSSVLGLLIGTFFERDQDALGIVMLFMVLLYGAVIVDMVGLEIPGFLQPIIPWIPSASLTRLLWFSYIETADWSVIARYMGMIATVTVPLLGLVTWKVRRMDR